MGYGDELMGSGIARGAAARGKLIAFGDGKRILWHDNAHQIFKNNANVARPGDEWRGNLEWVAHYPGRRAYHLGREGNRWIFNPDFRAKPGEVFFDRDELDEGTRRLAGTRPIIIEPNVKTSAPNKSWTPGRYQEVADALMAEGHDVAQLVPSSYAATLRGVHTITTRSFRMALAVLRGARLYVGPEGGLHHGAAALGIRGVVIFGSFTHPRNTGYAGLHTNIFVGDEPCGRQRACEHCKAAMASITVEQVLEATHAHLT